MKEWVKNHYHELLNTHGSAKSIAAGFSTGTFIAILPTPGIGILLGLITVFLFPKINKLSLFFAMAVFNPFLLAPLYLVSYRLGDYLLINSPIIILLSNSFFQVTFRLLLGTLVIGLLISTITYFLLYYLVKLKRGE